VVVSDKYDVVIVGGGHNALTAAAYLALAGKRVVVLERLEHVGGAAVSEYAFAGVDARLSRYSYLVSLLPRRIVHDLGLDLHLRRRRYSSYTPLPGTESGLLVDTGDRAATEQSFASIGARADAVAWDRLGEATARLASTIFPTVTEPLLTRSEARRALGDDDLWDSLIEQPVGALIESSFSSDLVRGVALTDALIGTFAPNVDESLAANRCFLYHVIGNGTGDWDVPVGGMGAVTSELARAARTAGAEIITSAEVTSVTPAGSVVYTSQDREFAVHGAFVLSCVAPHVLFQLLGEVPGDVPEGAQIKANLLLSRLPRVREHGISGEAAFGGTFHVNETWNQLDASYAVAAGGTLPSPLPCEIYSHSLSDPSILSPELQRSGAQTLTVFGLHVPHRLAPTLSTEQLQSAVVASIDSVLAEPIAPLLLNDEEGRPTIEVRSTRDLEHSLRMPGGNIFHGPLSWPFAEDVEELSSAAQRWGVATAHPRILLCGSGARRGGAVSGIGGHNAAMAVLEH
jgi:phytoene dehydrogenase-like protein